MSVGDGERSEPGAFALAKDQMRQHNRRSGSK